jgi:hypothetical protein
LCAKPKLKTLDSNALAYSTKQLKQKHIVDYLLMTLQAHAKKLCRFKHTSLLRKKRNLRSRWVLVDWTLNQKWQKGKEMVG